jgi:hypothetical protein
VVAPSPTGIHLCCPPDAWNDRFTYEVTKAERTKRTAELADAMGYTYQTAEMAIAESPAQMGDYGDHARAFFDALRTFRDRGAHPDPCEDCARVTQADQWLTHPVELFWWPAQPGRCPVARLHFALVLLALHEDLRHDLQPGDTLSEIERRGRERRVTEQLQRLEGATVGEIVNRTMSGGL